MNINEFEMKQAEEKGKIFAAVFNDKLLLLWFLESNLKLLVSNTNANLKLDFLYRREPF